jgi:two-component system, chemotaxis family, CheB/CheR fusion protein
VNIMLLKNGLLVIDAIRKSNFDLILMDIEMPEMNGYDTTKKIRNELSEPLSNIPIIAITADDSWQALNKCEQVGINDFVFKPIVFEQLVAKIKSVMAGVKGVFPSADELKAAVASPQRVFNLKGLYSACGESLPTVNNIISLFIKQSPENISQLKLLMSSADWPNLKNLCHKMKAVYSLLGLSDVKTYLEEMEDDCVSNNINLAKFEASINKIENLNLELVKDLEKILMEGIKIPNE